MIVVNNGDKSNVAMNVTQPQMNLNIQVQPQMNVQGPTQTPTKDQGKLVLSSNNELTESQPRLKSSMSCDVMISFTVKSMTNTAKKLQVFLSERGYSTWLCLDIKPGESYRDRIIENVRFCNIFVPLINEDWAISKECEFEYNIALKSFNKTRKPVIIPLIIGMFDTSQYNITEGILATTQVIFVENKDENAHEMLNAFKQICDLIKI